MKPLPTGSATATNTAGIVRVVPSNVVKPGLLTTKKTSGDRLANSPASRAIRSGLAPPQRRSIRKLRSSAHPNSRNRWRKASTYDCCSALLSSPTKTAPTRRIRLVWGCCARAASGHATAAPINPDINSRLMMLIAIDPSPCRGSLGWPHWIMDDSTPQYRRVCDILHSQSGRRRNVASRATTRYSRLRRGRVQSFD